MVLIFKFQIALLTDSATIMAGLLLLFVGFNGIVSSFDNLLIINCSGGIDALMIDALLLDKKPAGFCSMWVEISVISETGVVLMCWR